MRSAERASSVVEAVRAMARRSLAVNLDQSDPAAMNATLDKIVAAFNRIDILVNNAAWTRGQAVLGGTGSVQDIAEQVVTFCRAESVTGQVLVIDGGVPSGMR